LKSEKPGLFGFSAELNLLIMLCRYRLGSSSREEVLHALNRNVEWADFVTLIIRHKLIHVVYDSIAEFGDIFPQKLLNEVSFLSEKSRKKMFLLTSELLRLEGLLKEEGITRAWLKGPVLAQRLFGNFTLRNSSDLDVLIPFGELERADNILRAAGYVPVIDWKDLSHPYFLKCKEISKHIQYKHPEKKVLLEAHWRLVTLEGLFPAGDRIFNDLSKERINHRHIPVLNDYNSYIHLTLHGAAHQWRCLCWLTDIALMLRNNGKNLEDLLGIYIEENNLSDRLIDGMVLSRGVLLEAPKDGKIRMSRKQARIIRSWEDRVFNPPKGKLHRLRYGIYMLALGKNMRYKLQCLREIYLDFNALIKVRLPAPLFFLHYFLRPFFWIYTSYFIKNENS
jgi:hypothetical protein